MDDQYLIVYNVHFWQKSVMTEATPLIPPLFAYVAVVEKMHPLSTNEKECWDHVCIV